jgi:hypothetical protein
VPSPGLECGLRHPAEEVTAVPAGSLLVAGTTCLGSASQLIPICHQHFRPSYPSCLRLRHRAVSSRTTGFGVSCHAVKLVLAGNRLSASAALVASRR